MFTHLVARHFRQIVRQTTPAGEPPSLLERRRYQNLLFTLATFTLHTSSSSLPPTIERRPRNTEHPTQPDDRVIHPFRFDELVAFFVSAAKNLAAFLGSLYLPQDQRCEPPIPDSQSRASYSLSLANRYRAVGPHSSPHHTWRSSVAPSWQPDRDPRPRPVSCDQDVRPDQQHRA